MTWPRVGVRNARTTVERAAMTVEPLPSTLLHDRMPDWWRPLALDLDGEIVDRRRRGVEALRARAVDRATRSTPSPTRTATSTAGRAHHRPRPRRRPQRRRRLRRQGRRRRAAGARGRRARRSARRRPRRRALDAHRRCSILSAAYSRATPPIAEMPLAEYAERQLEHRAASLAPPARRRHSRPRERADPDCSRRATGLPRRTPRPANGRPAPALDRAALEALARADRRACDRRRARVRRASRAAAPPGVGHRPVVRDRPALRGREVDPAARPLVAAVELADRTRRDRAGARCAAALLRRILARAGAARFGLDEATAVAAAGPLLEGASRARRTRCCSRSARGCATWRDSPSSSRARPRRPLAGAADEERADDDSRSRSRATARRSRCERSAMTEPRRPRASASPAERARRHAVRHRAAQPRGGEPPAGARPRPARRLHGRAGRRQDVAVHRAL